MRGELARDNKTAEGIAALGAPRPNCVRRSIWSMSRLPSRSGAMLIAKSMMNSISTQAGTSLAKISPTGRCVRREIVRTAILEPPSGETRAAQAGYNRLAAAHDIPEQSCPVVFNHQGDRSLIDTEVIGTDPPSFLTVF